MKYEAFEHIFSQKRMARYLTACKGDKEKAMNLYKRNARLSGEMLIILSFFEVALRNGINNVLTPRLGKDWLRDAISQNGIFTMATQTSTLRGVKTITKEYNRLITNNNYDADQMIAAMEMGIWKYLYSKEEYQLTGQCLLKVFPNRPTPTRANHYTRSYFFNELDKVNSFRNRIAHHETICLTHQTNTIDLSYAKQGYKRLIQLMDWMNINTSDLLRNTNNIQTLFNEMMAL